MGLATIYSRACIGVEAPLVRVEVHISNGMPGFSMVGLPETSVREAKDRVRSAIQNSRFEFPPKRITVSLAPADLPKEGGRFDLPIALGILAASEQIPHQQLSQYEFVAELALTGALRPVKGVLPAAIATQQANRQLVVAMDNAAHVALVGQEQHKSATSLLSICQHLSGQGELELAPTATDESYFAPPQRDLQDIIGQQHGKRALEIAAAGGHNLLLIGPPGTGKTMLATRLRDLLPELTLDQAIETAAVTSLVSHQVNQHTWRQRPFRSPHHSASMAALVGGGSNPKPGEISLAHHGLLFLDELPEFERRVLDSLREPLESGEIVISRAAGKTRFPAQFQLVGALNPSPSGYYDEQQRHTNPQTMLRYLSRLSGPLLDRFDMSVEIPLLPQGTLAEGGDRGETTQTVKQRVEGARQRMLQRSDCINSELSGQRIETVCRLKREDAQFLESALHQLGLSIRAYHRILKVARTIADLEQAEDISRAHLSEALGYRAMDRLLKQLNAQFAQ